uniref:Uncharacterized protein n=1 Tax=Palpitomonas bilix TaxID=652834 RepID=A0A7S3LWT9_9EUKA|mmetsp:Transcript_7856/g.20444  ORF Transcript_7856/g.20444 Transcript_7856/m.20444 type:complete len:108 (+) Transcript_7856:126-449(+)
MDGQVRAGGMSTSTFTMQMRYLSSLCLHTPVLHPTGSSTSYYYAHTSASAPAASRPAVSTPLLSKLFEVVLILFGQLRCHVMTVDVGRLRVAVYARLFHQLQPSQQG